jgi:hypothetical protein
MVTRDTGRLITTATKNVRGHRELTSQERAIAQTMAPLIRQSRRNWLPIYVREISTHDYQLIDGLAILEATRLAEQKVIYCIQIDSSPETEEQIIKGQQLLTQTSQTGGGSLPAASVDLMPLLKQIETMSQALNNLGEKTEKIHAHLVPDKTLSINIEDERSLKTKLILVPGIGEATLPKVVGDILKNRPFYSEYEFKAGVEAFKPKKSKAKRPKHEQLWKDLKEEYVLDWSVAN